MFPLPEPQDLFLAAQVKFEDLSKDLRKLQRDLAGNETQGLQTASLSSRADSLLTRWLNLPAITFSFTRFTQEKSLESGLENMMFSLVLTV